MVAELGRMEAERLLSAFSVLQAVQGEEHVPFLLSNEAEYSGKSLSTDTRVPGRVLGHQAVYTRLGADPYIVETVTSGYRLEFDSVPPSGFVRLEQLGCIVRVQERPRVTLPLSLVFSNKWRLVVDASRHLNPYCIKRGIKLDDVVQVAPTIRKNDFMLVNDLDSGYWHVPIHPDYWGFLGVHHEEEDGTVTFWVWRVLCLGLRDAAHIFTCLLAPLMSEMRRQGMLTLGRSSAECLAWEEEAKCLFAKAGWVSKPAGRSGDPSQVCKFLGLVINSRDLIFSTLENKVVRIRNLCKKLVRGIARAVGTIQSVRLATGPIVSVMTRSLYHTVDVAARWDSFVKLVALSVFEREWWIDNIESVSKFPIDGRLSSVAVHYGSMVASDGSGVGHCCYDVSTSTSTSTCRLSSA
jgi:hypothetical protein